MATVFLEPGGDADFLVNAMTGFWAFKNGTPAVATDFVHGNHIKSIKYRAGQQDYLQTLETGTTTGRWSYYIYLNVLPTTSSAIILFMVGAGNTVGSLLLTTGGILQLTDGFGTQIGSNGATLNTGQWYRISLAFSITSTTVNSFALFVDGVSSITGTNVTLINTATSYYFRLGNYSTNNGLDLRTSDHYLDNSSSLTDPGNIWVTAKRPVSNGTTNGFTTRIGAGGSGYGTGHSPQVNERPSSTTNGWSMVGAGAAVTEEYNIETQNIGDMNITGKTIVDWLGWAIMNSLAGETVQIILNGANNSQAITSSATLYTKIKGSATYPAGSGTDIGIITTTALTTVSLYETGVIIAFIGPPVTQVTTGNFLAFM